MPEVVESRSIGELADHKLTKVIRFAVAKELRKLPALLDDRESVVNLAQGTYDKHAGLVVVTDRRVMFVEEGLMFRSRLEDFPYDRIGSVQTENGFLHGKLTIFASGNKAAIEKVLPKERAKEVGDYVRARVCGGAVPSGDVLDQLKKLGELRDAGILTPAEFEAKRGDLAARL